ncbi:MAG: hypothetical protein CL561_09140 [Alphaproteobacteria bacterium]|mgnify:CR=1 FL=1|nr:hypothetical protein [Alphaproteobacteria bacterium]|tara:strand:- start:4808 stop:5185 length:378 start_codon:yes stop_codon:yes gene_type:complete
MFSTIRKHFEAALGFKNPHIIETHSYKKPSGYIQYYAKRVNDNQYQIFRKTKDFYSYSPNVTSHDLMDASLLSSEKAAKGLQILEQSLKGKTLYSNAVSHYAPHLQTTGESVAELTKTNKTIQPK